MREIQASEAKTHLLSLLDAVEDGESVVITRHGRAIARLIPEHEHRQKEIAAAKERILKLRERTARLTLEEILSARDEGRK